ncbi:MAG: FAD-dependent oxidoreductase [Deltaproteobacteria bacterium]|nr:FAD-dependent oxidoreductase [Deltaproteobacteria bacterium]
MDSLIKDRYDLIVVGAGPAGTTAALAAARAGLHCVFFERAEEPGRKNMFGGVLHYSPALNELIPDFWTQAPVERFITKYQTTLLSSDSSLSITFQDKRFGKEPYNGFTLLRSRFDRWYAEKAREAGALLVPETTVEDLIRQDDQVIGVRTGRSDGALYADAVIVADGANSLLAEKAGHRKELSPAQISVAAKEVLALPRETINHLFELKEREGLAHLFLGECTRGVEGGGFLYTNQDSLSIGVVAKLKALQKQKMSIADLLEHFKALPPVADKIKNASLREYSGHLIPEGGFKALPKLFGNGLLFAGDAAGFINSTGLTLEGMNFAIASGLAAAQTVIRAREKGDFSERQLADYQALLENDFVLKDLKTFRRVPGFLSNPRLFQLYPDLACEIASRIYRVNGQPRKNFRSVVREVAKGKVGRSQMIKDVIQGVRALIWT